MASSWEDLTVQNIMDDVSQDVRKVIAETGGDQTILIDFIDRVHRSFTRWAEWDWMLSAPQRFITKMGQTQYYIGPGNAPTGTVQTGLNLTNVHWIKGDSVYNRSLSDGSPYPLFRVKENQPNRIDLFTGDFQARPGLPKIWFHPDDNHDIISIYPAPDNQNAYQPIPVPPNVETTVSGALPARTYYIRITFVDSAGGESAASGPSTIAFIPANSLVKVKSPSLVLQGMASGISYNQYKVYASTVLGSEQLQTASPINFGTDWTEPSGGLITGVQAPTSTTIEPMRGYIIEFRFIEQPVALTATSSVLQVPHPYKDVVVAGVNAMAFQYLQKASEASTWYNLYREGLKETVADKYVFGTDFVRPGRNP